MEVNRSVLVSFGDNFSCAPGCHHDAEVVHECATAIETVSINWSTGIRIAAVKMKRPD